MDELLQLQIQLRESAKRMEEYKRIGDYERELGEHKTYNELIKKISELKGKWHPDLTPEQIEELKAEGLKPGDPEYDQYLMEHGIAPRKNVRNGKTVSAQSQKSEWHPDLTPEQIEELKAEGLEPGDPEYNQYLMEHGIAPRKNVRNGKTVSAQGQKSEWHPDLTPEQIEELKAEGLEPGDPEYNQYLMEHGIDPRKNVRNGKTVSAQGQKSEWHPDLTPEQIEELKAEGLKPGDPEYDQYLMEHGIDPRKNVRNGKTVSAQDQKSEWHPDLTPEQIEELKAEGLEPGDPEYNQYLMEHGIDPRKNPKREPANLGGHGELGGSGRPEGQEEQEGPGGSGEHVNPANQRLPIRSFWEIYNDTCTEHVGSIPNIIYKLAHMPLWNRDEDTVQKVLSIIPTIFKAPVKLLAKLPNAILKTDEKVQIMKENIEELSPEDFQILVQSPEEVNRMFNANIKDNFDKDFLEPQFMKQYKVNNAYLDVVRGRLGRERNTAINYYNEQAMEAQRRINDLDEIGRENWTPDQIDEYNRATIEYASCEEQGRKCREELDRFDDGAKKKSSSHRNISGWFLAKFNPDNREQNEEMAELSKARREMGQMGDYTQVSQITGEMRNYAKENTQVEQIGRNSRNRIDVGIYSKTSAVETLEMGEQTKGRLALADVSLVASLVGWMNQVKTHMANKNIIKSHNEQLENVNNANSNITVKGKVKISDSKNAQEVQESIARQSVEAGLNRAERGNLDGTNWDMGTEYHQIDLQSHVDSANAVSKAESMIKQGNSLGALKTANDYYTRVQNSTRSNISNYMTANPQHDYSAFLFGDKANMSKVYEFFANGTIPYKTNVTATMAEMMGKLQGGLDLNGVLFSTANALYQSQREGIKDFNKRIKSNGGYERSNEQNNEQTTNRQNNEQTNRQNDEQEEDRDL